jgi:hypothetical protein
MLDGAVRAANPRPADNASRDTKKNYAEALSNRFAETMAKDLRERGLMGCCPDPSTGGVEKEFAGGIGAKQVDVSWSKDTAGLILGISIKTINFPDPRTQNYQKNLVNRRGDMLTEAVTLHRRFPYAVLAGFFFFHSGAAEDGNIRRDSTFLNAHRRLRMFTGRTDPGSRRDEQFERLYIGLYETNPQPSVRLFRVGQPDMEVAWEQVVSELLDMVEERNPDHFVHRHGKLANA